MTKLLVILVVALAACGGSKKDSSSPGQGPDGESRVDPTMPSWAPESCTAYQKAAYQAINCDAIDKAKRDEIEAAYSSASASWKAEQNADAARIEEVNQSCTSSTESVRAVIGDLCTPASK